MQIQSTYARRIKTSRRFVFENIMDLDHVCALHKKWFSNLRVRVRRPDRVEYRLTSLFYGLKQETRVSGGLLDEDHYWYEFLTRLARMRVEGSMAGPDGELTLTERISYQFAWPLAPVFWLLQPLFRRQKQDILHADTQLLERVYELDRAGFHRTEDDTPRVVVYGGTGFFGRLVVKDLLQHSDAHIAVAARGITRADFGRLQSRVTQLESDLNDYQSVCAAIDGASVVICCSGPYHGHSLNLLRACIEKKIHYVDVADDRQFVLRCYELTDDINRSGIVALIGCSVVPGMSSLLTRFCQRDGQPVSQTRIFITPGTRYPRGSGSFRCLLATVGQAFSAPWHGGSRRVEGWTERERVDFPPPLAHRWVYSVVDIPDYFLQPIYFGTQSVEFKIGAELDFLNRSLSFVRSLRRCMPKSDISWLVPLARPFILVSSLLGTSQGSLMVAVSNAETTSDEIYLSVFKEEHGEIIPAVLPSIAARLILTGQLQSRGLVPLPDLLSREQFIEEMNKRQIRVATRRGAEGPWMGVNY